MGLSELRGVTIGGRKHMESILREVRPELFKLPKALQGSSPKFMINVEHADGAVISDQTMVNQILHRRAMRLVQTENIRLSAELREANVGLQSAVESRLSLQRKLELTLPLIPPLLDDKIELAWEGEVDRKALQEALAQRWQALLEAVLEFGF